MRTNGVSLFVLLALVLPGLASAVIGLWCLVARSDAAPGGTIAVVFALYAVGAVLWSAWMSITGVRRLFAVFAAMLVLLAGQSVGFAAASLGVWSLVLPLAAIGGLVASLTFPRPHESY